MAARRAVRHSSDDEEDDYLVAPLTEELYRNLTKDEKVRLNIHQHWMVLWRPVAYLAGALFLLAIMLADDRLPLLVLLAVLAALGHLVWRILERRYNSFAATTRRVMRVEGLINRSVPMMRLNKVTDMRLDRPLVGRFFGYGTITIESAGQDQSIRKLTYTPYPTQAFRRLNATIFDEYPAAARGDEDDEFSSPAIRMVAATGRGAGRAARAARRGAGAARRGLMPPESGPSFPQSAAGEKPTNPVEHSDYAKRHFAPPPSPKKPDDTDEIPVRRRR